MKGSMFHEHEVALPANELWEVYSSLKLGELVVELLPNIIAKADVEEGDGGVGTVLRLTLPPGLPGVTFYKEKFVTVDHEKRLKEAAVIEGGYLALGFKSYVVTFQILEKGSDVSIIKSTIDYEVDEEHKENASFASITALATIGETISKYLLSSDVFFSSTSLPFCWIF